MIAHRTAIPLALMTVALTMSHTASADNKLVETAIRLGVSATAGAVGGHLAGKRAGRPQVATHRPVPAETEASRLKAVREHEAIVARQQRDRQYEQRRLAGQKEVARRKELRGREARKGADPNVNQEIQAQFGRFMETHKWGPFRGTSAVTQELIMGAWSGKTAYQPSATRGDDWLEGRDIRQVRVGGSSWREDASGKGRLDYRRDGSLHGVLPSSFSDSGVEGRQRRSITFNKATGDGQVRVANFRSRDGGLEFQEGVVMKVAGGRTVRGHAYRSERDTIKAVTERTEMREVTRAALRAETDRSIDRAHGSSMRGRLARILRTVAGPRDPVGLPEGMFRKLWIRSGWSGKSARFMLQRTTETTSRFPNRYAGGPKPKTQRTTKTSYRVLFRDYRDASYCQRDITRDQYRQLWRLSRPTARK